MNQDKVYDAENPFPEPVEIEIGDSIRSSCIQAQRCEGRHAGLFGSGSREGIYVRIIHGKGIGVQRETVRILLSEIDFVKEFKSGDEFSGGWGATVVEFF
ncbi:MAG: Smr/MutS family protein [Pyrinomonadaceae bacterium]